MHVTKLLCKSFEEIAELSKKQEMKVFQKGDRDPLEAMNEIKKLMQNPDAMESWFETKRKEFDALPESV